MYAGTARRVKATVAAPAVLIIDTLLHLINQMLQPHSSLIAARPILSIVTFLLIHTGSEFEHGGFTIAVRRTTRCWHG